MLILGIETSCDDTSIAIVENGKTVLSHVTASQVDIHNKTGGVVPEVAAREHTRAIIPVYQETLKKASLSIEDIDAIAVTKGPGLVSSLLIGDLFASTVAWVEKKPIIPIHHIEGHIYSNWLDREEKDFRFPIMILTASGGHNDLILMKDHGKYTSIGHTRDDAAGEAFDKVARILELPYPGGPSIAKAALSGNPKAFSLPRTLLPNTFDFSFSGVKSEALRIVQKEISRKTKLSQQFVSDFSASFQQCIVDVLVTKLLEAARKYNAAEIHLAGGVSANVLLRETVLQRGADQKFPVKFPKSIWYSTDNGAMIATCGYFRYKKNCSKYKKWGTILPDPSLRFI